MALALRNSLKAFAGVFAEVYSPVSYCAPIPIATNTTCPCNFDVPFTAAELRDALRILRRRNASGPDGISGQVSVNLTDTTLRDLLA